MNLRRLALDLLSRWEAGEEYINLTVGRACESLPDADRRYLTALLYGTVEKIITLDYQIGTLAHRSSVDTVTRNILRLGLYELFYMHTAPHATVNETVNLTRNSGEAGFVNGVLRSAARLPDPPLLPPRERNTVRFLSVLYSVPQPTVRLLLAVFGEAETEEYLTAVNATHGMTLRVNTCRTDRDSLLTAIREKGISAVPTPYAPYGIFLPVSCPPRDLPGFDEGAFYVQDEASQISTAALSVAPGMRVIDLCACPGGKSFGAAITMGDTGEVLAFDLHTSKLSLVESGAARLGLTSVSVAEHDGTLPFDGGFAPADRVICDVPCSGLGVLGKKADLRYKDIAAGDLPALQASLLQSAAACVKPGGILLYSTCTVNPNENGAVVNAFLAGNPDFTPLDFTVGSLSSEGGQLTLLPHRHHTDGFFIAKLERSHP